jgi:tellurite resistance protein
MGLLDALKSLFGFGNSDSRPLSPTTTGRRATTDNDLTTVASARPRMGGGQPIPRMQSVERHREWMGTGSVIDIAGRRLDQPLTYWIDAAHDDTPYNPSTILAQVRVGQSSSYTDPGYWPSYYRLSPDQRAGYLDWLAGGRINPQVPMGYVFIYFYGLEWRALIEQKDHQPICREIMRLHRVYGANNSFHSYAGSLLGHILLSHARIEADASIIAAFASHPHKRFPAALLEGVLYHYRDKGLPFDWIWYVAQHVKGCSNGTVQKLAPHEFRILLDKRYREAYPTGLVLPVPTQTVALPYHWAMGSSPMGTKTTSCYGYLSHGSLWDPIVALWQQVTAELKAFARTKSKPMSTLAAFNALPGDLRSGQTHPEQARWDAWYQEAADDHGYVVTTIGDLALQAGIPSEPGGRFKSASLRQLYALLDGVGMSMEPDPRLGGSSITAKTQRVVYSSEHGHSHPGFGYQCLRLLTEVCLSVAATQGALSDEKWSQLLVHLDPNHVLTPGDTERLRAFSYYYTHCDQARRTMTKARFAQLKPQQREGVAGLVVTIALADGVISADEQKALERIYKVLGLSKDRLAELVQASTDVAKPHALDINWAAVAKLQAETAQVQGLLAEALKGSSWDSDDGSDTGHAPAKGESAPPTAPERPAAASASADAQRFPDLDPRYAAVLMAITDHDELAQEAFHAACKAQSLMPAGVLDRVNEWAQEHLGDDLIIGEGPYTLQRHLLTRQRAS